MNDLEVKKIAKLAADIEAIKNELFSIMGKEKEYLSGLPNNTQSEAVRRVYSVNAIQQIENSISCLSGSQLFLKNIIPEPSFNHN